MSTSSGLSGTDPRVTIWQCLCSLFISDASPSLSTRLLAQLSSFVHELFSSTSHFTWMAPPSQLLEDLQQTGNPTGQNPENKLYRTVHGVVRDPRTGKGQ